LNGDPHDVAALKELGQILLEDEAFDETIALAERCLAEVPNDAECFDLRSMAKARSGRLDVREQEECYAKRPRDFVCVQGLAQARIQQGRYAEARQLIDQMRELDPDNALVPTMEAMVLSSEGDAGASLAKYQAACSMGQEHACKVAWELGAHRE
jgi:Flp pilus assembly protein TadD